MGDKLYGESWAYGEDLDPDCKYECYGPNIGCTDSSSVALAMLQCKALSDGKFKLLCAFSSKVKVCLN